MKGQVKKLKCLLTHPWRSHSCAAIAFCKGIFHLYGQGILPKHFNPVYLQSWVFPLMLTLFVNPTFWKSNPQFYSASDSILPLFEISGMLVITDEVGTLSCFTRYIPKRKYSTFEIVCDASCKLLSLSLTFPVCQMDTLTSLMLRDAIVKAAMYVWSPVKLPQVLVSKWISSIVFQLNVYLFTVKNNFIWLLPRIGFTKM